jgi:hypothetical protein
VDLLGRMGVQYVLRCNHNLTRQSVLPATVQQQVYTVVVNVAWAVSIVLGVVTGHEILCFYPIVTKYNECACCYCQCSSTRIQNVQTGLASGLCSSSAQSAVTLQQLCRFCIPADHSTYVEDLQHFLLECPAYVCFRQVQSSL